MAMASMPDHRSDDRQAQPLAAASAAYGHVIVSILDTKAIVVKTALLSAKFDCAATDRLVDSSDTKIITSADEMQRLTLITPLPCETKSDGSLIVYAWGIFFAIDFSQSYGFVILT
jgi:hypothetical protein